MTLLVFAHRGEAQTFIKELNAKSITQNTYQYEEGFIYICSEGIYDVLVELPLIIKEFSIKQIINYGIAGSLSTQLNVNEIYSISGIYLEDNNQLEFKSFSLDGEIECISAHKRVLNKEYANKLRPIAKIVDRELWAIAKVSNNLNISLKAYKLISDIAGENTDCFDLKERAKEFSSFMYEHFTKIQDKPIEVNSEHTDIELPFQMSQYQNNILRKLIKEIDQNELNELIKKYTKSNRVHKSDVNDFIDDLRKNLYPLKYKMKEEVEEYLSPFTKHGFRVNYDENFEKEKLSLNIEINSQKNIEDAIIALRDFQYSSFIKIYKGDINV